MQANTATQYSVSKQRAIAAQVINIIGVAATTGYNPRTDDKWHMQANPEGCITVNNCCKQCAQNICCDVLHAVQATL